MWPNKIRHIFALFKKYVLICKGNHPDSAGAIHYPIYIPKAQILRITTISIH